MVSFKFGGRKKKTEEEEVLAFCPQKLGVGEGQSNMLRTFENSSSCCASTLRAFRTHFVACATNVLILKQQLYKRKARSGPAAQHSQQFYILLALDRMSRYFSVWVSFVILPTLLLAVGAIVCSEKETLLKPIPSTVTQLTDCLMECTGMTYIKKLQLQDNHNIRFQDSSEGKEPLNSI